MASSAWQDPLQQEREYYQASCPLAFRKQCPTGEAAMMLFTRHAKREYEYEVKKRESGCVAPIVLTGSKTAPREGLVPVK